MRSMPAARSSRAPHGKQPPDRHRRPRLWRVAFALTASASIAFLVGACGSGSTSSSPTTTTADGATTGAAAVTRPGVGGQAGYRTTGGYTVAFAECMRAHGVPKFRDPNRGGNGLDPGSGVDPSSSAYQAALNGPCESLAPPGWVSSGTVTRGGGGGGS